ncbi:hypothetical protein Avbf_00570 [Armadillidium vulgare]|nr:hypothetical protein Avbf_00570 [Armadillidium vulgare]
MGKYGYYHDIPVQRIDGTAEGTKGLKIISEDQDGEEKDMVKSIRTPQGSSREKEKDKTRLSANLPLTNLVKKRDKDRNRNGERRDSDKKLEKERKSKQERDKENRSETLVNRNSVVLTSSVDMTLSSSVPDGLMKQTSPQQHIEMKTIPRIEDKLEDSIENSYTS